MTERELCLRVDFRHRAFEIWKVEERVVPKTACSPWRIQNDAFYGAVARMFYPAVSGRNQNAVISGPALLRRQITQPLQQNHVVPDIGIIVCVW